MLNFQHQESLLTTADREVPIEAGMVPMQATETQQLQQLMPKLSQAHQLQQLMQHQSLVLQHQVNIFKYQVYFIVNAN